MKTAVIFGSEGQDGRIAFDALLQKNYRLAGVGRNSVRSEGIDWNDPVDVTSQADVTGMIKSLKPDEIYYLAACHHSSQDQAQDDAALFQESHRVNVLGLLFCLEAMKDYSRATRLFYAGSSLLFENTETEIQDERTPFCPGSVYGITKLQALLSARYYREAHGLFASTGILYNHESPYRKENFISKKIIRAALNIKQGKQDALVLGDLSSAIDWGYAPDYVEAMRGILNADRPDEFIIATGVKHTVRDFVQTAFDHLGPDWKKYVKEDPNIMTRKRRTLVGNPEKLMNITGWRPSVDFKGMIELLLQAEGACV